MICFILILFLLIKMCFNKNTDPLINDKIVITLSVSILEIFTEFVLYDYFFNK